ncbi:MAG: M23 family metallopeptidase [Spirochaetales bacterium]|nr:M23 family metallopeptidase [Spirochaetales bacterium]
MDMQNVIGEQYIAPRRSSGRSSSHSDTAVRNRVAHATGTITDNPFLSIVPAISPRRDKATDAFRMRQRPAKRSHQRVHLMTRMTDYVESLSSPQAMRIVLVFAGMALLAVAIAAAGAIEEPADLRGFLLPEDGTAAALLLDAVSIEDAVADDESMAPALPVTVSLSSYKVAKNDTLDGISRRFGVRLDTLISVNGITDVRRLVAGSTIKIPNIDGVVHNVRKGESISGIASARGVSVLDLIDANDLATHTIQPGQALFIPGARLSSYDLKKALGQLVIWPLTGKISSYFGYRPNPFTGIRQFHNGLDIVAPANTSVRAAMSGRVAETGYSALFGNFVILSHPEGYQTLYAHLNRISVRAGTSVEQGHQVGLVGSTGYSTGPHLHFGVFKNGKATDPLKLLKGR